MTPNTFGPIVRSHIVARHLDGTAYCWLCTQDVTSADVGKDCQNPGLVREDDVLLVATQPHLHSLITGLRDIGARRRSDTSVSA